MKARVKATGEIVEVMYSHTANDKGYDIIWYITPRGACFSKKELEFIDTGESLDYWEKLRHQYAGMAMQGIVMNEKMQYDLHQAFGKNESMDITISEFAIGIATTLVNKLKGESNG